MSKSFFFDFRKTSEMDKKMFSNEFFFFDFLMPISGLIWEKFVDYKYFPFNTIPDKTILQIFRFLSQLEIFFFLIFLNISVGKINRDLVSTMLRNVTLQLKTKENTSTWTIFDRKIRKKKLA